jgi:hypothetical protein
MCDIKRANGRDIDVRFGSLADMTAFPINVRFTPESGHRAISADRSRRVASMRGAE